MTSGNTFEPQKQLSLKALRFENLYSFNCNLNSAIEVQYESFTKLKLSAQFVRVRYVNFHVQSHPPQMYQLWWPWNRLPLASLAVKTKGSPCVHKKKQPIDILTHALWVPSERTPLSRNPKGMLYFHGNAHTPSKTPGNISPISRDVRLDGKFKQRHVEFLICPNTVWNPF